MRILIDCTQIPLVRTGVGVYAENLVRELIPRLRGEDRLFILLQSDDVAMKSLVQSDANVRVLSLPAGIFRRRPILAVFEQFVLPWVAFCNRLDIIHSIHYTFPLFCACKRIVTVHDLTHSLFPELHTWARRLVTVFFCRRALRRAQGLLFDSASTEKDFERVFGAGKYVGFVAPLGVSPVFFHPPPDNQAWDALKQLGIEKPFILFIGTIEPRKNLDRLVEAFERISMKYPEHLLVIAGRLGWSYARVLTKIESSPLKKRILRLGYVSPADKHALLAMCEVLVYPSIYEGFGLPVLEGMAMGKAVITSNISSMAEVAGDAAITVDPTSTEQIQGSLEQLLSNPAIRKMLGEKGRRQASAFSWKRTAEVTYGAYSAVVDRCPPATPVPLPE